MRNSRNLVLIEDAKEVGHRLADVPMKMDVVVPPSGLTGIVTSGGKCFHGVYIPVTSPLAENYAEYCSICRPFEIAVRDGGVYKA
jgi:hypothetical protein